MNSEDIKYLYECLESGNIEKLKDRLTILMMDPPEDLCLKIDKILRRENFKNKFLSVEDLLKNKSTRRINNNILISLCNINYCFVKRLYFV